MTSGRAFRVTLLLCASLLLYGSLVAGLVPMIAESAIEVLPLMEKSPDWRYVGAELWTFLALNIATCILFFGAAIGIARHSSFGWVLAQAIYISAVATTLYMGLSYPKYFLGCLLAFLPFASLLLTFEVRNYFFSNGIVPMRGRIQVVAITVAITGSWLWHTQSLLGIESKLQAATQLQRWAP